MAFGFNADAQLRSRFQERTSISFGGQLGTPLDEFKDVYGEASYGVGGTFVTKNRFPFVYTGLNYSYARMGKITDEVQVFDGENIYGNPVWEGYDASVSNKVHRIHTVARFEPFKGKVQPYVEGLAGAVIYNSRLTLQEESGFNDPDKSNLETSVAGSLGWSAGLKVQLVSRVFLEGRVENLMGSNVRYMNQSQTSSRIFQVGISFEL